jgi:hypothetical protein
MVENAPAVTDVITDFYKFIEGAVVAAHHAPFDLGFIGYEFEKKNLMLPTTPALWSRAVCNLASSEIDAESSAPGRLMVCEMTARRLFKNNTATAGRHIDKVSE